jgi:hypothetical protein
MVKHEVATPTPKRFRYAALEECNAIDMSKPYFQVEHRPIHRENT